MTTITADEISVPLADGRRITAAAYGPPDAPITCLHHPGTGSSRLEAAIFHAAACEVGVRVVGIDRPGVGGSSPSPARTLADWPADALAVADHLGLETFVVSGVSGGGPHALVVAALAPARVTRCVPMNSGPPADDPALLRRIPANVRFGPALARRAPWLFGRTIVPLMASEKLATRLGEKQLDPDDLALHRDPDFASLMQPAAAEGRRDRRFFAEALLLWARPWPFDPYALSVPVTAVTGERDPFRPFTEALAQRNAHGRLLVVPGGHLGCLAPRATLDVVRAMAA